ncbi:MAG: hypothetical protein AAF996_09450 [Pseudomonadota bacterium]
MRTLGLLIKIIIAFILYGIIGLIVGILSSLLWPDITGEGILWWTGAVGLIFGLLGASVPFTRNRMLDVLALFSPSNW